MSVEIDCDNRKAPRIAVRVGGMVTLRPAAQSLVRAAGRKPQPMMLRDISRTGMSLETKGDEVVLGMTVTVKVEIRQTECEFPAKVVWIVPTDGGAVTVGLKTFVEVLDSGTRNTLQSLFSEVERRLRREEEERPRRRPAREEDDEDPEKTRVTRLPAGFGAESSSTAVTHPRARIGRLRLVQRRTASGIG